MDVDRASAGRRDFLDRLLTAVVVDVHRDDRRAFLSEQQRRVIADAAAGAGDECYLVLQPHEMCSSVTRTLNETTRYCR